MKLKLLIVGVAALAILPLRAEGEEKANGQGGELPVEPAENSHPDGDLDPFANDLTATVRAVDAQRGARRTISVLVRLETFDVPTLTALTLLDAWKVTDGADGLRSQVVDLAKTKEASIRDLQAATVEAGSKATLETIHEYIYPTEYVPPGLGGLAKEKPTPETPLGKLLQRVNDYLLPTSFETRNVGSTLEFEIGVVAAEEGMWDVRLAPELVEMAGLEKWGPEGAQAEMPNFNSVRVSSTLRVRDGLWILASMQTPHDGAQLQTEVKRLQFLKVERAR